MLDLIPMSSVAAPTSPLAQAFDTSTAEIRTSPDDIETIAEETELFAPFLDNRVPVARAFGPSGIEEALQKGKLSAESAAALSGAMACLYANSLGSDKATGLDAILSYARFISPEISGGKPLRNEITRICDYIDSPGMINGLKAMVAWNNILGMKLPKSSWRELALLMGLMRPAPIKRLEVEIDWASAARRAYPDSPIGNQALPYFRAPGYLRSGEKSLDGPLQRITPPGLDETIETNEATQRQAYGILASGLALNDQYFKRTWPGGLTRELDGYRQRLTSPIEDLLSRAAQATERRTRDGNEFERKYDWTKGEGPFQKQPPAGA